MHSKAPLDCGVYTITVETCTPAHTHASFLTITNMVLDVLTTNDADAPANTNDYDIVLRVTMQNYPAVTTLLDPFKVTIRKSCRHDTFTDFTWSDGTTAIAQFEHEIDGADDIKTIKMPHTNTLSTDCTLKYELFQVTGSGASEVEALVSTTTYASNFVLDNATTPT